MVKVFGLIAFIFSSSAFAQNVSFHFEETPLNDVVNYVLKHQIKRDYVISPDVQLDKKVSFRRTNLEPSEVVSALSSVFASFGVSVTDKNGVIHVQKTSLDSPPLGSDVVGSQSLPGSSRTSG